MTFPIATPGAFGRAGTPFAAIVRRLAVISALALTVCGLGASTATAGEPEDISTERGAV